MPISKAKLDFLQKGCREIMDELDYREMWGVDLVGDNPNHTPTRLILAKYLQANAGNSFAALRQLRTSLEWRKKSNPRKLMETVFDSKKFAGLAYVHDQQGVDGRVVVIFNLYGNANRALMESEEGLQE